MDGLCPECDQELQPRLGGYCFGCGRLFALAEVEPYLCAECRHKSPVWHGFGFLGPYDGLLRELVLDFKFHARFELRKVLRSLLLRAYAYHFPGLRPDCIVPVPLHTARLRERGFNQSLELCRPLALRLNAILAPKALSRLRDTASQSGLDRAERRRNMRDSVAADPALVESRRVLLVDDVYTTGITAEVCARALLLAGAEQVDLLVLARVPGG